MKSLLVALVLYDVIALASLASAFLPPGLYSEGEFVSFYELAVVVENGVSSSVLLPRKNLPREAVVDASGNVRCPSSAYAEWNRMMLDLGYRGTSAKPVVPPRHSSTPERPQ